MTLSRRHLRRSAGLLRASTTFGAPASKPPGFLNHSIRRGDGRGGWLWHRGEIQFLHRQPGGGVKPFGIARMDNGEVALAASWDDGSPAKSARDREKPVITFSRDNGQTWSDFQLVAGSRGRPVMFTDLGGGRLFFQTDLTNPIHQFFSQDYGRSWPEQRVLQPPTIEGSFAGVDGYFGGEGNAIVERGPNGKPGRVGVIVTPTGREPSSRPIQRSACCAGPPMAAVRGQRKLLRRSGLGRKSIKASNTLGESARGRWRGRPTDG